MNSMLHAVVRRSASMSASDWKPPPGFVDWTEEEEPPNYDASSPREHLPSLRRPASEPPSRIDAELDAASGYCLGCGARFQSTDKMSPGYIPPSVLDETQAIANEDGIVQRRKSPICQRCHGLRYQNRLPAETLRVGTDAAHAALQPDHFLSILKELSKRRCLIILLVDLFDFHGSLMPQMGQIVGTSNPVVMVANKLDLLPQGVQLPPIERWIKAECRKASLPALHSLHIVSCKTGSGLPQLLSQMQDIMAYRRMDAYVVGAANAGKSSFINYCLKKAPGKDGALTTSHLPGTTLGVVRVSVMAGQYALFDTPGIILPTQVTSLLDTTELAAVVPKKRAEHVTLRVAEGKSVLLGGLARINMLAGRPFLFTFYLANAISIHPTPTDKVEQLLEKHIGGMLAPPSSAERLDALSPFVEQRFEIDGRGWDEPAVDLVLPGLGWVSVTGSGSCTVGVSVPASVGVSSREPLIAEGRSIKGKAYAKFTGSVLKDGRGNTKRRRTPARAKK